MGRKSRPQGHRKPQKSKSSRKEYVPFPVNAMSEKRFEKGDKDGGYDNWIPVEDADYPVDKTQLLNTSNANVLIPKHKKEKERY